MTSKRATPIAEYITNAPREGQPHAHCFYAILKSAAPDAEEAIKRGNPFFIEPRLVFACSKHKAPLSFAPSAAPLHEDHRAHAANSVRRAAA